MTLEAAVVAWDAAGGVGSSWAAATERQERQAQPARRGWNERMVENMAWWRGILVLKHGM